ncbi:MAG: HEPN domain-containing protein [Mariniphaga sp.]
MVRYLKQYEILFSKAKADLFAANILYAKFNEGNTDLDLEVICFHLQQCAEKIMKAVLSVKQVNYPKIHDLETLLNIIKDNGIDLHTDNDLLIELNDYAVEGRYSVMHDDLENVQNIFVLLSDMLNEASEIVGGN